MWGNKNSSVKYRLLKIKYNIFDRSKITAPAHV